MVYKEVNYQLTIGSVTREIYKWKEDRAGEQHLRRNSEPEMIIHEVTSPSIPHASDLREPGMFRRNFLVNRAVRSGKPRPSILTRNFIDFLVLYGFYGGDVYPSDNDDDSDFDTLAGAPRDEEEFLEDTAPLLRRSRSTSDRVKGTSDSKAFFMLAKAFVGTGVLFLPKAFENGGMVFSIVLMVVVGLLTLHCMLLLTETSQKLDDRSFGDLGLHIYGEWFRQVILYSIAVSQMVNYPI